MRELGLIGYPLSHSESQNYFDKKFDLEKISDAKYSLFSIKKIEDLKDVISLNPSLLGLNVTSPYKEVVLDYVDEIDQDIVDLKVANTIKFFRSKNKLCLKAYNTDVFGVRTVISSLNLQTNIKALVLGSGGSGKSVVHVLNNLGIPSLTVSRNPQNKNQVSYEELTKSVIEEYLFIINASPVGMFPNDNICPNIPYAYIRENHICFDLIYKPKETLFLQKCRSQGAKTINGELMFQQQAEKPW